MSSGRKPKRGVFVYLSLLVVVLGLLYLKGTFLGSSTEQHVNQVKNDMFQQDGHNHAISSRSSLREGPAMQSKLAGPTMDQLAKDGESKNTHTIDKNIGADHHSGIDKEKVQGDVNGSNKDIKPSVNVTPRPSDMQTTMRLTSWQRATSSYPKENEVRKTTDRRIWRAITQRVPQNTGDFIGKQGLANVGPDQGSRQPSGSAMVQGDRRGQEVPQNVPNDGLQRLPVRMQGQMDAQRSLVRNQYGQNVGSPIISKQELHSSQDGKESLGMVFYDGSGNRVQSHEKWIVVTSINAPTKDVIALSKIPGWKLVVVGDTKTPKDWKCPNVVFLDVESQMKMGLKTLNYLPFKSYGRKNIGYLFAIKFGAKFIYDTDDDNQPNDSLRSFSMEDGSVSNALVIETSNVTYNPYPHFGQRTIWPRGFPLEYIMGDQPREYKLCKLSTPLLRQGVVNGDPDVDAIYRLIRKHPRKRVNLLFDTYAPRVVLPVKTFSPYNSQNTISTYDAFWGLLLPVTVTLRVTDIWRSYWAQRLSWMIGHQIAFYTAGTFQFRSPHSYLKDFKEEKQLYHQTMDLVNFLSGWQCQSPDFFQCVKDLSFAMVPKGFWEQKDAKLVEAWLDDLVTLGYKAPMIKEVKETCLNPPTRVIYYPHEQEASFGEFTTYFIPRVIDKSVMIKKFVHNACPRPQQINPNLKLNGFSLVSDILLIIRIKNVPSKESIGKLESYYRPRFSQILYCGSWQEQSRDVFHYWRSSFIDISMAKDPTLACLLKAVEMHYLVAGYMVIQQEMLVNTDRIQKSRNSTWMMKDWISQTPQLQCRYGSCRQETLHLDDVNKAVLVDGRQDTYSILLQRCPLNKPGIQFSILENNCIYVPALFNKELRNIADGNIQSAASIFLWLQCSSPEQHIELISSSNIEVANGQTDIVENFDFNNIGGLCPLLGYDA